MSKMPIIEFIDYNFTMSLIDFFTKKFEGHSVFNKQLAIVQSYFDKNLSYVSPSLSIEIMYRKNRSLGFNNFIYDIQENDNILEFEGNLLEYRVQLNVYSNTRGEIYKWCSILDNILKNGDYGIPLNVYLDNGDIKQDSAGLIEYDYSNDIKNNHLQPNVVSYDFHTIYEIKMNVVQLHKAILEYAEIGSINSELKN
jgi:hypothetical protein